MTKRRHGLAATAIAVVACLGGGCAATRGAARPAVAAASNRTSSGTLAVSLESQDQVLAVALLKAAARPAAGTLDAVAYRYYQLGVRDVAMDFYARALARDPRDVTALDGRARIWRDWGQLDDALREADRAVRAAPGSAQAWNTRGTIMQFAGRDADAAADYRRAVRLDPGAAYAMNNLCYLSFLAGDAATATAQCSQALSIDGGFVAASNNLGLVYAAGGEAERAYAEFSKTTEAQAQYNLGIVLMAQKKYAAAVKAFEAAYRANPGFAAAHARARRARTLSRASKEKSNVSH